jgi:hypothetical protein
MKVLIISLPIFFFSCNSKPPNYSNGWSVNEPGKAEIVDTLMRERRY